MGINKSKLQCLILPAQSGKTRKVEEEIARFSCINRFFGNPDDLNIWISANNKMLVHQTTKRIQTDLCSSSSSDDEEESDAVIKGSVFSWTSGTKKTNITAKELVLEVIEERVEMIILCAHSVRIRYLKTLLEHLNASKYFNKKINIWIDEADKSINLWNKYPELINIPHLHQVTLVSATMDDVVKVFGRIRVRAYQVTHPACYRRLKDCITRKEDGLASSPVEYVKHVLNKHTHLSQPGMRAFIPGDFTQESHEEIAALLVSRGFAVIIINGKSKEVRFPNGNVIDLVPYLTVKDDIPDEFCETLARICCDPEHGLDELPLAITGFMCVERGITFQCKPKEDEHNGFLFDYGIIPPITDKAEAYQTMARLFGNIGDFPDYKPSTIYTNSATFKRVENQEEIAVNLARIVAEQDLQEVTLHTLRDAANYEKEKNLEVQVEEFPSLAEANAFLAANSCRQHNGDFTKDAKDERFILTSTTGSVERQDYAKLTTQIAGFAKSSNFDLRSSAKANGRLYVGYKDLNDPKTAVYIVRVVKRIAATVSSSNAASNPFE
jgi:hypothetical protein